MRRGLLILTGSLIHAALATGLDYEDYQRWVFTTKSTFDRYAQGHVTTVSEASAKAAMSAAVNDHRFAQSLWATTLLRDGKPPLASFEGLGILLEHFPCPALASLVDTVTRRHGEGKGESDRASAVVDRAESDRAVRLLWSCATDKIAEAERIIGTTKP